MANELYREIPTHNNEEITKIAKDMYAYASKELKSFKEMYPGHIPSEVQPQLEFYKDMIRMASSYLTQTEQWPII
jgi:hypothetical protein